MVCSFDLSQHCWKHWELSESEKASPAPGPMKAFFCEWSHSSGQDPPEDLPWNMTAAVMAYNCPVSNPQLHHPSFLLNSDPNTESKNFWMMFCQAVDSKACVHFKVKWNGFKEIPEFKVKLAFNIWPSAPDSYKYLWWAGIVPGFRETVI